jgi:hypothetical protein
MDAITMRSRCGCQQSAYGIESRLGSRLQRFVKALSTQSGSGCNIGDAACFGNVTHSDQKCVLIGVFERSSKILGNGLFVVEIITGVEWGQIQAIGFTHNSIPQKPSGHRPGLDNVTRLFSFRTTTEQHIDHIIGTTKVDSVTGPKMNPHF